MRCLQRYTDTLESNGITGYGRKEVYEDYRLMLCLMIFDPIWDCVNGSSPDYWIPKLSCLLAASEARLLRHS